MNKGDRTVNDRAVRLPRYYADTGGEGWYAELQFPRRVRLDVVDYAKKYWVYSDTVMLYPMPEPVDLEGIRKHFSSMGNILRIRVGSDLGARQYSVIIRFGTAESADVVCTTVDQWRQDGIVGYKARKYIIHAEEIEKGTKEVLLIREGSCVKRGEHEQSFHDGSGGGHPIQRDDVPKRSTTGHPYSPSTSRSPDPKYISNHRFHTSIRVHPSIRPMREMTPLPRERSRHRRPYPQNSPSELRRRSDRDYSPDSRRKSGRRESLPRDGVAGKRSASRRSRETGKEQVSRSRSRSPICKTKKQSESSPGVGKACAVSGGREKHGEAIIGAKMEDDNGVMGVRCGVVRKDQQIESRMKSGAIIRDGDDGELAEVFGGKERNGVKAKFAISRWISSTPTIKIEPISAGHLKIHPVEAPIESNPARNACAIIQPIRIIELDQSPIYHCDIENEPIVKTPTSTVSTKSMTTANHAALSDDQASPPAAPSAPPSKITHPAHVVKVESSTEETHYTGNSKPDVTPQLSLSKFASWFKPPPQPSLAQQPYPAYIAVHNTALYFAETRDQLNSVEMDGGMVLDIEDLTDEQRQILGYEDVRVCRWNVEDGIKALWGSNGQCVALPFMPPGF